MRVPPRAFGARSTHACAAGNELAKPPCTRGSTPAYGTTGGVEIRDTRPSLSRHAHETPLAAGAAERAPTSSDGVLVGGGALPQAIDSDRQSANDANAGRVIAAP
jgi:hypothetical protein